MHLLTWSQVHPFFWTLLPQAEPMSESVFQTPHKTYSQPRGKTPFPPSTFALAFSLHLPGFPHCKSGFHASWPMMVASLTTTTVYLQTVPATAAWILEKPPALLGSWFARVGWDVNRFPTFSTRKKSMTTWMSQEVRKRFFWYLGYTSNIPHFISRS